MCLHFFKRKKVAPQVKKPLTINTSSPISHYREPTVEVNMAELILAQHRESILQHSRGTSKEVQPIEKHYRVKK